MQAIEWCKRMRDQAAREGNLVDFENYGMMLEIWSTR